MVPLVDVPDLGYIRHPTQPETYSQFICHTVQEVDNQSVILYGLTCCCCGLCVRNKGLMPCVIEVCNLTPDICIFKKNTAYHFK